MEARILGPDMIKSGYSKGYAANVIGWTGLITATIPPGVGIIIYGTVGEVSIGQLFAAGLVVGLLMMAMLMITVAITARMRGYKPEREKRATFKEIFSAIKETIWAMAFPFLLLFGIRTGIFTPSEVGSFACVYAVCVGVFVYKELTWKKFVDVLESSIKDIGAIMFIIALSGIFGYGIPFEHVPDLLTGGILGITKNPYIVMLLIIFFLIVLGMFMDGSVIILLFTPIFLPLVRELGVDPVHFGLVFCTTITLGNLTPPIGLSMYTVCSIMDLSVKEWIREMWPFLVTIVIEVSILVFLPDLVLSLPRLFFGT